MPLPEKLSLSAITKDGNAILVLNLSKEKKT